MSTQPIPYVQSSESLEVPPPYQFPGVTINAFIWEAPMGAVQAYCDRFFNIGSDEERGFVYKAAAFWPYAMLLFIDYPEMIPSGKPWSPGADAIPFCDHGVISQREVFVAVPVVRYGLGPVRLVLDTTLEWTMPFIVVDMPGSAICGREMLGMGKMMAEIGLAEARYPESFSGTVDMMRWPSAQAGVMQEQKRFLTVTTGPTMPTFRGSDDHDSMWSLLRSREAGLFMDETANFANFLEAASLGLAPIQMRTLALKQIRDAAHQDRALYQALVTARSKYGNITNFKFYKEKDVTITFEKTGSFSDVVSVFLEPPYQVEPKIAFRFNADIELDEMRTIHTFPVDRGPGLKPVPASSDLVSRVFRPWAGFFGQPRPSQ